LDTGLKVKFKYNLKEANCELNITIPLSKRVVEKKSPNISISNSNSRIFSEFLKDRKQNPKNIELNDVVKYTVRDCVYTDHSKIKLFKFKWLYVMKRFE